MKYPGSLYMDLNTSVQQFVERLNDLNRYLLYVPEENSKQLDQAKAPEWHEVIVNVNIDIFECLMKNLFLISSV
jgi:hypothetical protein